MFDQTGSLLTWRVHPSLWTSTVQWLSSAAQHVALTAAANAAQEAQLASQTWMIHVLDTVVTALWLVPAYICKRSIWKTSLIHNCHQDSLVFMLHKLICKNCIWFWCLPSSGLKTVASASYWFWALRLSERLGGSKVCNWVKWDHDC